MKSLIICVSGSFTILGAVTLAQGCGPGDGCEVTATCPVTFATGGAAPTTTTTTMGAGASGGTGGDGGAPPDLGEPCDDPSACSTGQCVDGVCCDTACDGVCQSCAIDGLEGTCSAHAGGTDPDTECDEGVCDGVDQCSAGEHLWSKKCGGGNGGILVGEALAMPDGT